MTIVFACVRFDQYLDGQEVINVDTDHKPLVPIPLLHERTKTSPE